MHPRVLLLLLLLDIYIYFGIAWNFALFTGTVATCLEPRPLLVCCAAGYKFVWTPRGTLPFIRDCCHLFAASPFVGLLRCLLSVLLLLVLVTLTGMLWLLRREIYLLCCLLALSQFGVGLGCMSLPSSTPRSLFPFKHYSRTLLANANVVRCFRILLVCFSENLPLV